MNSYFALLDKLYSLRKQMEKVQDYYENKYMSTVKRILAKDVKKGDYVKGLGKIESVSNQSHIVILRCGKKRTVFGEEDEITIITRKY
jgi:hypothetical protein